MLTKATIKKLYAAPIEVHLWNGNYNVASVKIHNNKKEYELHYELSHIMLEKFSGKRDKCVFLIWDGHRAPHLTPPEELKELVQRLREAATMSDETVKIIHQEMCSAAAQFRKDFCLDD